MNRVFGILVFVMAFVLAGCSAKKQMAPVAVPAVENSPAVVSFSNPETWLLGYFTRDRLSGEPHSSWYIKGYDEYQPAPEALARLGELSKDGLTIKIVLGTWCPDSRREVPHYIRIMDLWGFQPGKITFIGTDNFKNGPVGEYPSLNIERVPTFIVYRNNIEQGRIIENPVTSLEQDMVNILSRNEK